MGGFLLALIGLTSISVHGSQNLLPVPEVSACTEDGCESSRKDFRGPLSTTEATFISTMRSCLSEKCFNKAMGANGDVVRIGVLGLPGSGAELVKGFSESVSKLPENHHIVFDTHAPAYGYGKNHGWTRIIRFSRDIFEHAHHLVSGKSAEDGFNLAEIFEIQVCMRRHLIQIDFAMTRVLIGAAAGEMALPIVTCCCTHQDAYR